MSNDYTNYPSPDFYSLDYSESYYQAETTTTIIEEPPPILPPEEPVEAAPELSTAALLEDHANATRYASGVNSALDGSFSQSNLLTLPTSTGTSSDESREIIVTFTSNFTNDTLPKIQSKLNQFETNIESYAQTAEGKTAAGQENIRQWRAEFAKQRDEDTVQFVNKATEFINKATAKFDANLNREKTDEIIGAIATLAGVIGLGVNLWNVGIRTVDIQTKLKGGGALRTIDAPAAFANLASAFVNGANTSTQWEKWKNLVTGDAKFISFDKLGIKTEIQNTTGACEAYANAVVNLFTAVENASVKLGKGEDSSKTHSGRFISFTFSENQAISRLNTEIDALVNQLVQEGGSTQALEAKQRERDALVATTLKRHPNTTAKFDPNEAHTYDLKGYNYLSPDCYFS